MIVKAFPKGATLPNLIVYIDRRDGAATPASLFALSEARRIAHAAGLTVFALVLDEPQASAQLEPLADALGRAGADRVLVCEAVGLGAPPLDATHGPALYTATERVPPMVVLFPTGGPGDELGPSLAMRLGAAFARAVDIVLSDEAGPLADGVGRINLRRWRADRSGYRQLDPVEIERPVIAVLGAHGAPREDGTSDIDVEVITCTVPTEPALVELTSEPDELDRIGQARELIVVGPRVPPEVAARLRASAPVGVAFADDGTAPEALAAASPEVILAAGGASATAEVSVSPRTAIAVVEPDAAGPIDAAGAPVRVVPDFVLKVGAGGDAWSQLMAAWSARR